MIEHDIQEVGVSIFKEGINGISNVNSMSKIKKIKVIKKNWIDIGKRI